MLLADSHQILFVANANRNTVTVFDTRTGKSLETLTASLYPNWPCGSTPNDLALTPNRKTLFVANADNNNLAVFDVSQLEVIVIHSVSSPSGGIPLPSA